MYDDGVPIAESRISSGTEFLPTPTGVFSVIQKQRWHRSNLYSDAPMPFMQRITWSGVALHAGKLPGYPASHGCIRLPDDFAVRLFRTTAIGARVVITQRETAPVEISHPRLFMLPAPDAVPMAQAKPLVQPRPPPQRAVRPHVTPATTVAGRRRHARPGGRQGRNQGRFSRSRRHRFCHRRTAGREDAARRPGFGFRQPQGTAPLCAQGFRAGVRHAGHDPNPDQPLGTHLFVAMYPKEGSTGARWMVVSPPAEGVGRRSSRCSAIRPPASAPRMPRRRRRAGRPAAQSPAAASAALDRIEMPPEAVTRISELMTVGAALTVSDEGLGPETGKETDFTVVTSPIQPTKQASTADRTTVTIATIPASLDRK